MQHYHDFEKYDGRLIGFVEQCGGDSSRLSPETQSAPISWLFDFGKFILLLASISLFMGRRLEKMFSSTSSKLACSDDDSTVKG